MINNNEHMKYTCNILSRSLLYCNIIINYFDNIKLLLNQYLDKLRILLLRTAQEVCGIAKCGTTKNVTGLEDEVHH